MISGPIAGGGNAGGNAGVAQPLPGNVKRQMARVDWQNSMFSIHALLTKRDGEGGGGGAPFKGTSMTLTRTVESNGRVCCKSTARRWKFHLRPCV